MRRALAIAVVAMLGSFATSARAQPSTHAAAAEELFRAGRALIAQHRYKEACEKLALSQRLDPAVGTSLSLGECYSGQGRTASAWLAYRGAVAIAASHTDPRSAAAEERANALEPQLSRLVVHMSDETSDPDARIALDGESFARDAFHDPVPIDPGDHAIVVTAPGFKSWATHITVGALAGVATVEIPRLTPLPNADEIALEQSRRATRRTAGFVLGGAGVVAVGVGSILGLQAIVKIRDAHYVCPAPGACDDTGAVHQNNVGGGYATASTILIPVGVALLGAGAYFALTSRASRAPEIGTEVSPAGARVRVGWAW
jgi:hypothetical protein